jgi:hypothetical protein
MKFHENLPAGPNDIQRGTLSSVQTSESIDICPVAVTEASSGDKFIIST